MGRRWWSYGACALACVITSLAVLRLAGPGLPGVVLAAAGCACAHAAYRQQQRDAPAAPELPARRASGGVGRARAPAAASSPTRKAAPKPHCDSVKVTKAELKERKQRLKEQARQRDAEEQAERAELRRCIAEAASAARALQEAEASRERAAGAARAASAAVAGATPPLRRSDADGGCSAAAGDVAKEELQAGKSGAKKGGAAAKAAAQPAHPTPQRHQQPLSAALAAAAAAAAAAAPAAPARPQASSAGASPAGGHPVSLAQSIRDAAARQRAAAAAAGEPHAHSGGGATSSHAAASVAAALHGGSRLNGAGKPLPLAARGALPSPLVKPVLGRAHAPPPPTAALQQQPCAHPRAVALHLPPPPPTRAVPPAETGGAATGKAAAEQEWLGMGASIVNLLNAPSSFAATASRAPSAASGDRGAAEDELLLAHLAAVPVAPTVRAWLHVLGLSGFVAAFERDDVALADLPLLSDADLQRMGLPAAPRRRVLAAGALLRQQLRGAAAPRPTAATPLDVALLPGGLGGEDLDLDSVLGAGEGAAQAGLPATPPGHSAPLYSRHPWESQPQAAPSAFLGARWDTFKGD